MTAHDEIFPRLVEAHDATLYRFALSLAKSAADATDLTQQTFLFTARIHRGKRQLRALLEERATGSKSVELVPAVACQ